MNIKQLLSKGNELISSFKNGYYKKELDYYSQHGYRAYFHEGAIVSVKEIKKKNSKAVDAFKANFQKQIYEHLSYLIVCLDTGTIFEKEHITNLIKSLSNIFFDDLDSENDTYWQTYETILEFEEYDDFVFKSPKDFTKEYVLNIISKNPPPAANKEQDNDKSWFIVSLKFVDGTVYDCKEIKKGGFTGEKFAELVFSKEAEDENLSKEDFKRLVGKTRQQIGDTLNFIEGGFKKDKGKNLFKKTEESKKRWLKVINHCKIKPSQPFIDDFMKVYDYDPTK